MKKRGLTNIFSKPLLIIFPGTLFRSAVIVAEGVEDFGGFGLE